MSRGFELGEIAAVLRAAADGDIILVGGQALSFWCEQYQAGVSELQRVAPFTSDDADFQGSLRDVEFLASELAQSEVRLNHDAHDTLNVGAFQVTVGGEPFLVQCISSPLGLTAREVRDWALEVELEPGVVLRVMHPAHCMQSRVVNATSYLNRNTPRELDRVRASVLCVREYIRAQVADGATRPALKLIKHVFQFALRNDYAQKAFDQYQIDCMDAVEALAELPSEFLTKGLPRMLTQLEKSRLARASAQSGRTRLR